MNKLVMLYEENKKYLSLFVIWFFLWAGLNTKFPDDWDRLLTNPIAQINTARFFCLYLIPIFFYFYFFLKKTHKFNFNLILICIFGYFLSQMIGFANFKFLNPTLFMQTEAMEDLIVNGYNLRFSYSFYTSFALLLPLPLMAIIIKDEDSSKKILFFSILILASITFLYSVKIFHEFINSDKLNLYYLSFLTWGYFFDMPAPRATGAGRWYLILYIFLLSLIFFHKNEKKKFLYFILLILAGSMVYLFQSRSSIYFLFLSNFVVFFRPKKLLNSFVMFSLLTVLIPLNSALILKIRDYTYLQTLKKDQVFLFLKDEINQELANDKLELSEDDLKYIESLGRLDYRELKDKEVLEKLAKFYYQKRKSNIKDDRILEVKKGMFQITTGRNEIWKDIIYYSIGLQNSNFIFGYGPQADRYLVFQNASNGFMYVLICSGIIGLFIFLTLLIKLLIIFFKIIFNYNILIQNNHLKFYHVFAMVCIIFFGLRLIVENSFTVYGLDYLLFLSCFGVIFNLFLKVESTSRKIY